MSGVTSTHTLASLAAMLADLSGGAIAEVDGDGATQISTVTHDSHAVGSGSLFACLRGERVDGHDFAATAVEAGAAALLVDRRLDGTRVSGVAQLIVDDTRLRLGPIAASLMGAPSTHMTTVGITGTNGKTTTSLMLEAIFIAHGQRVGVIGTLNGPRTTPEAPELQQRLAEFVADGCSAAVVEVSSHALTLHRVDGTHFDAVVFTNFGHDHLDLHGTPEDYFRAKASLFDIRFAPLAVINLDDTHGRLLSDVIAGNDGPSMRVVTYSAAELTDVEVSATSLSYEWSGRRIHVGIGGAFNVCNSLAAVVTATEVGVPLDDIITGLAQLGAVPGRFETVAWPAGVDGGFSVVVDYAHTPDGLAEVIAAARAVVEESASVIIVFGCGGDRDHGKRSEMGAVAAGAADRVIVTSDNPRSEEPMKIITDVVVGVPSNYRDRVTVNPDRQSAIGDALNLACSGDIVVIAGKGHEKTQDLGDRVVEFDDRAMARSFMESSS
ncbi:MAG: UDP-N-acetylmuramoyl-L-alanyl-D-glutamate--2,6-diaminopimelate ligase [Gammaproteobacteria bacterium]|jgi:UDP-N-acetylmuramoyl-L-alanyl-D-glutamate--2,6-diaminopimelate ligase